MKRSIVLVNSLNITKTRGRAILALELGLKDFSKIISLNNGLLLWSHAVMLWRHAVESCHGDIKISVFVYSSSHYTELESLL